MKNKILLFSLLFSITAHSATPTAIGISPNTSVTGNGSGLVPAECLSGTGACKVFSVTAGDNSGNLSAGGYYPFYKNGSLWQVGNGVTAYCFNQTGFSNVAHGNWQLMSSSNSFAFAGTPSGVIYYQAGAASKYHNVLSSASTNTPEPIAGIFSFSQNYWPGIQASSASTYVVHLDCYEK